jgi:Ca2+-binding RTX toxin-like protein
MVMNSDGSGQTDLMPTSNLSSVEPDFSPDSSKIVFRHFEPQWEYVYMCKGRRATIVGSDASEKLKGTKNADTIVGNGGKDKIYGRGGNDRLSGGPGKDTLVGGKGKDKLSGGPGKDKVKQ